MATIGAILVITTLGANPPGAGSPSAIDYVRDVKPILSRRCVACHGALKQSSALRLDTAAAIRVGGDAGPAVEPGHSDESLLVDKVIGHDGRRMPPEGEPLTDPEVQVLRRWIDAGASAPPETPAPSPLDHWSYRPPIRPAIPLVADPADRGNPIDAFLAADRGRRGLVASRESTRSEGLRRVALGLTGLAPTREELRAYLADESTGAYEAAVDRLLSSPAHGERWGRHWMDVWRYSDWAGYGAEVRESKPHIWRWRDWIVASLNADKGYDRMVVEMLAGDEVAPLDEETLRATGYLARNWYKFNRDSSLQNTVDNTAKAFLGLTIGCARCHDHKYDPVAQADYYRFRSYFEPHDARVDRRAGEPNPIRDGLARVFDADPVRPTYLYERGDDKHPDKSRPISPGLPRFLRAVAGEPRPVPLPDLASRPSLRPDLLAESVAAATREVEARKAGLDKAVASLATAGDDLGRADLSASIALKASSRARAEFASLKARTLADRVNQSFALGLSGYTLSIAAGRAERVASALKADESTLLAELARRDAKPAGVVKADAALVEARKASEAARAAFAKADHSYTPLGPIYPTTSTGRRSALARAIVDRRNPLTARVAVNHVWMRHFGRPLVASVADFGHAGASPTHPELLDWLAVEFMESGWSFKHLHRLIVTSRAYRQSSTIADATRSNLAIDPENAAYWRMNPRRMEAELVRDNVLHLSGGLDRATGGPDLGQETAETTARRSLYYRHAAEKQVPFLKLFDAANVAECYRRYESVVPQQALALANSPQVVGAARRLGGALSRSGNDDEAFVIACFEQVLSRPPTVEERSACLTFLAEQSRRLAADSPRTAFAAGPVATVPASTDPARRAREDLALVLFNHNDFVTIR